MGVDDIRRTMRGAKKLVVPKVRPHQTLQVARKYLSRPGERRVKIFGEIIGVNMLPRFQRPAADQFHQAAQRLARPEQHALITGSPGADAEAVAGVIPGIQGRLLPYENAREPLGGGRVPGGDVKNIQL